MTAKSAQSSTVIVWRRATGTPSRPPTLHSRPAPPPPRGGVPRRAGPPRRPHSSPHGHAPAPHRGPQDPSRRWRTWFGVRPASRCFRPALRSLLPLQRCENFLEIVGFHQYVARLRALTRPDHATTLQDVHQPSRLGEADPELALQHRRGPELRRDDELDGLDDEVHVVADVVVKLPLALLRRG